MRAVAMMVAAACLAVACEARGVDVIRSVENPHMEVSLQWPPGSCRVPPSASSIINCS
jgi:hypothetical protein